MPNLVWEDKATGETYSVPISDTSQEALQAGIKKIQQRDPTVERVNSPQARPQTSPTPQIHQEPTKIGGETVQAFDPRVVPQEASGVEGLLRGFGRGIREMSGKAVLPTAGSLAFEKGGQLVPGLRNLPAPVRSSLGSVLGTGANMALGIEEPSLTQLGLAAVTPAATEGAGQLSFRQAKRARAAGLIEEVQQVPGVLARRMGAQSADDLFKQAYALSPRIGLTNLQAATQRIQEAEARLNAAPMLKHGTESLAGNLRKAATPQPPTSTTAYTASPGGLVGPSGQPVLLSQLQVTPGTDGKLRLDELDTIRQALGGRIGTTENSVEKGQLKHLYAGLMQDLEEAARQQPTEAAQLLLQGISTARRQFAIDDLQTIITGPSGAIGRERSDGLYQVNFGKIIAEIQRPHRNYELLGQFLDQHPGEKAEILALLRDMNRRNVKFLPPAGAMFGSGVGLRTGAAAASGAFALNKFLNTPIIDPAFAGTAAVAASAIVSKALMTAPGRAIVKEAIAPTGVMNTTRVLLQLVGQQARAEYGEAGVQLTIDAGKRLDAYGRAPTGRGAREGQR